MKNILKILPVLLLTILVSCKKKDPKPEPFDITQYTIVGKLSTGYPYVINLQPHDKATLMHVGPSDGKFTYVDGVLKLDFNGKEVVCTFVIENNKIKSYQGPIIINTYNLVKIPATNQFDGKTFKGSWNNAGYLTQIKFTADEVTFTADNRAEPFSYTLINNLAALQKQGNNNTLFILMDEKLESGRYISYNECYGRFMQQ